MQSPRRVTVHGPSVTSVQRTIEPQTGRGRGFALEWTKVGGRGRRAAAGISSGDSGTDFKGNSRHNSGEVDRAQIDHIVRRYGQKRRGEGRLSANQTSHTATQSGEGNGE